MFEAAFCTRWSEGSFPHYLLVVASSQWKVSESDELTITRSRVKENLVGIHRDLSFSGLLSWFLSYYFFMSLSSSFSFFSSAHKPQVWKSRFLRKAGETGRGFVRYSVQGKEQVSSRVPLIQSLVFTLHKSRGYYTRLYRSRSCSRRRNNSYTV